MNGFATYLFLLALSPILVLAIHAAILRILGHARNDSPQLTVGFSILIGYGIFAFLAWVFYLHSLSTVNEFAQSAFYGFIVYTCLSYSYFHFFNISETARRFQILVALSSNRKVYRRYLAAKYNVTDMVKTRLERLVQFGQLTYKDGRYYLKRRVLCSIAQILMMWAVLLRFLGNSEK